MTFENQGKLVEIRVYFDSISTATPEIESLLTSYSDKEHVNVWIIRQIGLFMVFSDSFTDYTAQSTLRGVVHRELGAVSTKIKFWNWI